jgi:hypothetical protein
MISITSLVVLSCLTQAVDFAAEPADRLTFMKDSAKIYEFTREGGPIQLRDDPVFRLGDQGGGVKDGAIFLWNDPLGRPEAAAQVFFLRLDNGSGIWLHEFTSLSTRPFVAVERGTARWAPNEPGVSFKPIPGAPKPAVSALARLRQMRALANEFKAQDMFGDNRTTYEPLRLLTTPVARYGKAGAVPEDGTLFAFVEGTDPEVFLFIEERKGPDGPQWQFACAPMSCWALKVQHKGKPVWDVPRRQSEDPSKPFFNRRYVP